MRNSRKGLWTTCGIEAQRFHKAVPVTVLHNQDSPLYEVWVPDVPVLVGRGDSIGEAFDRLRERLKSFIEHRNSPDRTGRIVTVAYPVTTAPVAVWAFLKEHVVPVHK